MTYQKYSEEMLLQYLQSHAGIENFFITCLGSPDAQLIKFYDSGKTWCLMEDDDILVADAVEFLKSKGMPVFYDLLSAEDYVRNKFGS